MEIALVEENGALSVDRGIGPSSHDLCGHARWSASGWINDHEADLEFSAPPNPAHPNSWAWPGITGTFHGRKVRSWYEGELTYTFTEPEMESPWPMQACTVTRVKVKDLHSLSQCGGHCR